MVVIIKTVSNPETGFMLDLTQIEAIIPNSSWGNTQILFKSGNKVLERIYNPDELLEHFNRYLDEVKTLWDKEEEILLMQDALDKSQGELEALCARVDTLCARVGATTPSDT